MSTKKFKHLTSDDRINIQGYLSKSFSIRKIAKALHVSPSTISREINKYSEFKSGINRNSKCELLQTKYTVCNQCEKRGDCWKDKIYYNNTQANNLSRQTSKDAHSGIRYSISTFKRIATVIENGLKKGHSIEYIYHNNPLELCFTPITTIYYWLKPDKPLGYLRVLARRIKRYKSKYKYVRQEKIRAIEYKAGKTMTDYINYTCDDKNMLLLEIDSLEGKKSDHQRILTIFFKNCALQLGILYETKNAPTEVRDKLTNIIKILREEINNDVQIVILADNGIEFDYIYQIEDLNLNTRIFFTNPYRSTDKARCERNHELFRYVVPKSISLDKFNQEDINEIFSNINNYARESLNWMSPYNLFKDKYPASLLTKLGLVEIKPNEVDLRSRF